VVGIDGSAAATQAAQWAAEEAAGRDIPLRLVYVIDERTNDMSVRLQYAETALRAATRAVEATARPVGLETSIIYGSVDDGLAEESKAAVMVCVGSVGIGRVAWKLLGSTAAILAERAHCPVAIIRRHDKAGRWQRAAIAVAVENSGTTEAAVELAMHEASLRGARLLAVGVSSAESGDVAYDELDRRMDRWRTRYPGVDVHVVTTRDGICDFLAGRDEPVALAVIATDGDTVANLVGPVAKGVVHRARCSVLVVPTAVDRRIAGGIDSTSSIMS